MMKKREAYRAARRDNGPDGWQMLDEARELRKRLAEKERELAETREKLSATALRMSLMEIAAAFYRARAMGRASSPSQIGEARTLQ